VSKDARNSLTALVAVSLFFCAAYGLFFLLRYVELPHWTTFVFAALSTLNLIVVLFQARSGRRARTAPGGR
jgi:hypothetical protein